MNRGRVIVIGGGAAGFFAAITCSQSNPSHEVILCEKSSQFLGKVRISGGGRCNVTHACFDPRELTLRYPRGEKNLISPFHQFQARETVDWFETRGVKLKTEADGRMFPSTDSSETIIDCLTREARAGGVQLRANCSVETISRAGDGFLLLLSKGEKVECAKVLIATGGCRSLALGALATSLGHSLEPPVPSLFTFHIADKWIHELAGVSVPSAEVSIPETKLRERGPVLFTHWGFSGPAILRLSAWGARELHERDYRFPLVINWLGESNEEKVRVEISRVAANHPAKLVLNTPIAPLTQRLWEKLLQVAGIDPATRWSQFSKASQNEWINVLMRSRFEVSGKSLNKDEFVTCGGVRLKEVNFKTMESRICPNLYFAGEVLDIDGITGGFNFQSAWTTGWIAGTNMARSSKA